MLGATSLPREKAPPSNQGGGRHSLHLQRKCDCASTACSHGSACEEDERRARLQRRATSDAAAPADSSLILERLSVGREMDSGVRSRMERGFSTSFAGVRVHTDAVAGDLARSVRSHAFTIGRDIAFAPGTYRPGTLAGDLLIAHELAHTGQQTAGGAGVELTSNADALEVDADRAAVAAVGGGFAGGARVTDRSTGLSLQRCDEKTAPPSTTAPAVSAPAPGVTPPPPGPPPEPTTGCTRSVPPGAVVADHRVTPDTIEKPGDAVTIAATFACRIRDGKSHIETVSGTPVEGMTIPSAMGGRFTKTWFGTKLFGTVTRSPGTFVVNDGDYRHRLSDVKYAFGPPPRRGAPSPDLFATGPNLISPPIHVRVWSYLGAGPDHYHYAPDNVSDLAEIVQSEMGVGNADEQTAIAWAVRNQMVRSRKGKVADVRGSFGDATGSPPTPATRAIADAVLRQPMSHDTTSGAIRWFSPRSMPKRGERARCTGHGGSIDCAGGLITVTDASDTPRAVYAPSWTGYHTYHSVTGVRDWFLRLYSP
jgi:hypothetical protein